MWMKRLCLAAIAAAGFSTATAAEPVAGRYCGTIWSGGIHADAQTNLTVEPDGRLSGSYTFAERGGSVAGELAERSRSSGPVHELIWTDRYGSGILIIEFTPDGRSFKGAWGPGSSEPTAPWSGRRCDGDVS